MTTHNTDNNMLGLNHDSPWWMRILVRFGLPMAMVIMLTLILVRAFLGDLAETKQLAHTNNDLLSVVVSDAKTHMMQSESNSQRLEILLRQICANTAKVADDRRVCFDPNR